MDILKNHPIKTDKENTFYTAQFREYLYLSIVERRKNDKDIYTQQDCYITLDVAKELYFELQKFIMENTQWTP